MHIPCTPPCMGCVNSMHTFRLKGGTCSVPKIHVSLMIVEIQQLENWQKVKNMGNVLGFRLAGHILGRENCDRYALCIAKLGYRKNKIIIWQSRWCDFWLLLLSDWRFYKFRLVGVWSMA